MKRVLSCVVFVAMTIAFAGPACAGTAFTLPSENGFSNGSWSFGEIFTVGPQNIAVTALGALDVDGNGFVTTSGIPVGIFRESDDLLLTSTTVVSADPLIDRFRYAAITPLTLLSGQSYRVVAVSRSDLYNVNNGFTVDPAITRTGYGYCATTSLTSCDVWAGTEKVWMANFQFDGGGYVPEPLSFILSGAGLAGLLLVRRRRRAA